MAPANTVPRVIAGKVKWYKDLSKSAKGLTNPTVGKSGQYKEKSKISMIPSQKLGKEVANNAEPRAPKSHIEFFFEAARTPSGIATRAEMIKLAEANRSVTESFSTIS